MLLGVQTRGKKKCAGDLAGNCIPTEMETMMKKGFALAVLCFAFSIATIKAEEVRDQKDWVKGAVVIGVKNDGGCVFKAFIFVANAENDPDDDTSQILGYEPGNVVVKNGTVVWERVSESVFIPLRQRKTVHGRLCNAPPYNE